MTGYAAAKEVSEKLKKEKAEAEEQQVEVKEKALQALGDNYYQQNANVGLGTLGMEDVPVPTLSVIQKGSKVVDSEGRPYAPGMLYYKALKQAFKVVECNILTITKKNMPSYADRNVLERTYMFLGAMQPAMMPFLMYNKSTSYFAARAFIGEVKARKFPMFALKVQITTENKSNDKGDWFVPVFNIVGTVEDPEQVILLENLAKDYEENAENVKSEDEMQANGHVQEASNHYASQAEEAQEVNPDDVPF